MARICKSKGCQNEIPDGWKIPYCDACRYRMAKKVRDGAKALGGVAVAAVVFVGKDVIIKGAKATLGK